MLRGGHEGHIDMWTMRTLSHYTYAGILLHVGHQGKCLIPTYSLGSWALGWKKKTKQLPSKLKNRMVLKMTGILPIAPTVANHHFWARVLAIAEKSHRTRVEGIQKPSHAEYPRHFSLPACPRNLHMTPARTPHASHLLQARAGKLLHLVYRIHP